MATKDTLKVSFYIQQGFQCKTSNFEIRLIKIFTKKRWKDNGERWVASLIVSNEMTENSVTHWKNLFFSNLALL